MPTPYKTKRKISKLSRCLQRFKCIIQSITINGIQLYPEVPTDDQLNITLSLTDGTDPIEPDNVSLAGGVLTIDVPRNLEIYIPYSTSDTTASITILSGSDGIITAADTTGLTSVTYEINAVAATLPLTLAVADVLTINFDAAAADGVIKLEGSYA